MADVRQSYINVCLSATTPTNLAPQICRKRLRYIYRESNPTFARRAWCRCRGLRCRVSLRASQFCRARRGMPSQRCLWQVVTLRAKVGLRRTANSRRHQFGSVCGITAELHHRQLGLRRLRLAKTQAMWSGYARAAARCGIILTKMPKFFVSLHSYVKISANTKRDDCRRIRARL